MHILSHALQHKIRFIVIGIGVAFCIIIGRLAQLQIHQVDVLFSQSQKNYRRIEKIIPPRGNIIDRSGTLLVTNRPVTNVYWQGSGKRTIDGEHRQILNLFFSIMQMPETDMQEIVAQITQAERYHKKIILATDLTFEQVSQLEEQCAHYPAISLSTHFERYYPYNTYASHILGYLSYMHVEPTGSMGLEKVFENTLKGQEGSLQKTINSLGKHLHEVEVKKALAGQTIHTTLDLPLQQIVETVFPPSLSGTFILMDPEDGAIHALVSRPNFDPSLFLHALSSKEWETLQENRPFLNRAFNACYPPGSLFKLVSMSALLEHNFITPDATVYCCGYSTFCDRRYYCHRRHGHGELTAMQALAHSCNIPFFEAGKKIDINLIASYANIFGLGNKTDIIFSEKTGLVPNRQWKLKTKKERWWQGETLSAMIGQSFLLVTPIQIARMIASIFTGYLVKPRMLVSEEIIKEPLQIKASTRAFLKKSMRFVVKQGTGHRVSKIKDITIYAKTSTAQTSKFEKRLLADTYKEHGWFAGYFTYSTQKPMTFVLLLENVGSSQVSAEVVRDFLLAYKKLIDES